MSLFLPLTLHIVLILVRGYFLSVEFTLYPYFTAHGFLPYQNIIDQHFPILLFGPFSLPAFLTTNPWPLLAVFLAVLCLTDIFFYFSLLRFKVRQPFLWLTFYIVSMSYFSGNTLWYETFINLLLAILFFLSSPKANTSRFISGLLISQIILLRPTILPAILFLVFGLSLPITANLLMGFLVGIIIPGLYLSYYHLITDFYRLAIEFNQQIYPHEALLLPAKRQVTSLFLWLLPSIYCLAKRRKFLFLLSIVSSLILSFPRFGFEHLQPLILCTTFFWALNSPKQATLPYFFILLVFFLNLFSSIRHPYGNYFLSPEVKDIARIIKELPGKNIYLLGASDLIYPLSGKLPPHFTYLPSLPWYFTQEDLVDKVIKSIADKETLVVLDYSATIDGVNLVESSGKVYEYIRMNFTPGEKIGNYQFFIPTK